MNINTESYRASINGMLDRLSTNEMSEAARLMTLHNVRSAVDNLCQQIDELRAELAAIDAADAIEVLRMED